MRNLHRAGGGSPRWKGCAAGGRFEQDSDSRGRGESAWSVAIMNIRESSERSYARMAPVGAVCAASTVLAQTLEQLLQAMTPPTQGEALLLPWRTVEGVLAASGILRLLFLLLIAASMALGRWSRAPGAALVGFASTLLVVAFELAQRAMELFLVRWQWAREYQVAPAVATQEAIVGRVAQWHHVTDALFFAAVLMLLVASCAFALAFFRAPERWARLVSLAWALNAARLVGRLIGYASEPWRTFMGHVYFPVVLFTYGSVAVWSWCRWRRLREVA